MNRAWHTLVVAAFAAMLIAAPAGSSAYSIPHGAGDWARMAYNADSEDGNTFVFLGVKAWGTQYYDGVPPQNNGGLGDGEVCIELSASSPTGSTHARACSSDTNFAIDSLRTVTIDDTIQLEVDDGEGVSLGTETATLSVTITGTGAIFPGVRGATNPGPGVEAEYELMRNAVVSGSITSPSAGTVVLDGTAATLERKNCLGLSIQDSDSIQACRFN